jgi:DNA-binding NarL/FixJ family response regulator
MVADDRLTARRRLRSLLEESPDIDVIDGVGDAGSACEVVRTQRPMVLVLDLSDVDPSHVATIRALRHREPDTKIVVVGPDDDLLFVRSAIAAGATAYVRKESADRELTRAIHTAAGGHPYLSAHVAALLRAADATGARDLLSPRETEILRLIASGYTTAEIAVRLDRSVRTIETHRAAMLRKLGFSTRGELVRYAWTRGLLGDGPVV